MIHLFSSLMGLLKTNSVCIDNNVFKLHCKVTVVILMSFLLIVTSRQYIGDPIDCIVDEIPSHIMNTYCWIHSTFTLTNNSLSRRLGLDMISPGVRSQAANNDEVKYHKYYQWVCFALFFQAVLFYVPHYLWKTWEAGRLETLSLNLSNVITSNEEKAESLSQLVNYFRKNLHYHNFYVFRFMVCEFLNFVNVVAQIYFVDYFLDGEFRLYGTDVLSFVDMDFEQRVDPMTRIFPKITKCTFRKFGPSGSVQNFDGMCLLPINIVNEKVYIFLWFWFVFLALTTSLWLIHQTAVVFCRPFQLFLLRAQSRRSSKKDVEAVMNKCQLGDWFILYQLGKNIDAPLYNDLMSALIRDDLGEELAEIKP